MQNPQPMKGCRMLQIPPIFGVHITFGSFSAIFMIKDKQSFNRASSEIFESAIQEIGIVITYAINIAQLI